jgi:hypothetical protein
LKKEREACKKKKSILQPGVVIHVYNHVYNPSYSRGRNQKDHGSRSAQAKSKGDPISTNKPGMVVLRQEAQVGGSRSEGQLQENT